MRAESQGVVIIDYMMNLPLLYWAGKELGDPRFYQIAQAHADMVMEVFVRPDFTVFHVVQFDAETGEYMQPVYGQGKSPDSVWSRGQAWAIYGFAVSFRETGKQEYLDTAKNMARHFYESLSDDLLPLWDFCSDEQDAYAKDASAACIAASGMLEMARFLAEGEEKTYFISCAEALLRCLIERCARFDDGTQGIIDMGTVN